jgi:hypothetical protein
VPAKPHKIIDLEEKEADAISKKRQRKIKRRKEVLANEERKRQIGEHIRANQEKRREKNREKRARKLANRLELRRLEGEFGNFKTRDDFVNAVRYQHVFTKGHDQKYRREMLHRYLNEKCRYNKEDRLRFWAEYKIFELTDQILNYFFPTQKFSPKNAEVFFSTAEMFFKVAGCDSLSLLGLETVKIEDERAAGDECVISEKLKYFLERYKRDKGFEKWTPGHMHSLSRIVHEALQTSRAPARPVLKIENHPVNGKSVMINSIVPI